MLRIVLAAWILAAVGFADQNVEVRVVNVTTGSGIPDVPLKFLQYGQILYSGSTDAGGRFQIDAAKEGPYTVLYQAAKFWPAKDTGLIGNSIALEVAGGAEPVRLEIGLSPVGKISGRVIDAAGKPVPKARIDLSAQAPPFGGWVAETNEKGEFSNEDMRPGTWTLAATAPPSLAPPEAVADRPLGWIHTYYPNAPSRDLASPIVMPPGGEFRDMDIRLAAVPVHRIRGTVVDPSGNPVSKASVTLDAHEPPALHQDTRSDGTFELPQVPDGECRVSAILDKGGVKLRAAQWVQVKGRDLENVELRLTAPFSIQGKIAMEVPEGAPAPKVPSIAVRSADMFGGFDSALPGIGFFAGDPDGKGGFTIGNLYPGPYYFLPGSPPAGYYLDSIRFGARDALAANAQILPGDLPLTITYKRNGGAVRGGVESCRGGALLLIPHDPALRRDGFIRRAACTPDGRFEILAVRPGDYYGMVVTADNPAAQPRNGFPYPFDLDRNLMNRSVSVTVRANETTLADLH